MWIVLLGIGMVCVLWMVSFNTVQAAVTRVDEAWAGVEVQLKRRHDLVPVLVNAVKAAQRHDAALLGAVLEARQAALAAMTSHDPAQIAPAEAELGRQITRLIGYAEDTPDITATATITTFMRQMEETEDQIAAARRLFNGNVQALNARLLMVPTSLVGRLHGVRPAAPFMLDAAERHAAHAPPQPQL